MPYDKQVIVQSHADNTIKLGSGRLQVKAQNNGILTKLVEFPEAGDHQKASDLNTALTWLTKNSRLYLRGHGNWQAQTVGGVDAQRWARTLLNEGLRDVQVISICACQAGRDLGSADTGRLMHSADSFAAKFHRHLRDMANLEVALYARVYNVIVRAGTGGFSVGEKTTGQQALGIASTPDRAKSKLRFSWVNGRQIREWVDYQHGGTTSVEADLGIVGVSTTTSV
jgi:hypothetical protein